MTSRETIPHTAEGAIQAIKLLAERDAEVATLRAANAELLAIMATAEIDISLSKSVGFDLGASHASIKAALTKHKSEGK